MYKIWLCQEAIPSINHFRKYEKKCRGKKFVAQSLRYCHALL